MQEQHGDRARLYEQWRRLGWTIYVDALNTLGHRVVPIPMLIDPNGRVVTGKLRNKAVFAEFIKADYEKEELPKVAPRNAHAADALFHKGEFGKAIAAFSGKAPAVLFKRGVALRARFESRAAQRGDGQAAVEAWSKALSGDPNQYIWRRRLQQYGPRLAKPYNFYSWIRKAREEIKARGEQPVPLRVEPRGAELIDKEGPAVGKPLDADPQGRINRDKDGLIRFTSIVTPTPVVPGDRVRVRLLFKPAKGLWNNEAAEMTVFCASGKHVAITEGTFSHPLAKTPESSEVRTLEFEAEVAKDAPKTIRLIGYALYYVCDKKGGTCTYLRRDFTVEIRVDKGAARIQ